MTTTNNKKSGKSRLTGVSVLAVTAAMVGIAPATAQEANEEEAIVVTGTRLVRQDFEAISPVTTIGAEQLELTATLTTESLLNELPQVVPGNTTTSNNAPGFPYATVDLRGLGVNRTLVLVNGERVPASSTLGGVDINTIPASLISRIEVVTGGASAVYGSDAVAGVVNFVLKDDYEGAEISLSYGAELETGNVPEFEINGLVGGNFGDGRGNLTAYASYYNREGIFENEYDYSRVSGAVCYDISRGPSNAYFVCDSAAEAAANVNGGGGLNPNLLGGSSTPPWGWVQNNPANAFNAAAIIGSANVDPFTGGTFGSYDHDCNPATLNEAYGSAAAGLNLSFSDAGGLSPRLNAGACFVPDRAAGSSYYNFAPDNYLLIPAERAALTTSGHYDITDTVRLNVYLNYTNSRTEIQLAPTPATNLAVTLTPTMRNLIMTEHPDLWDALQSRPQQFAPFTIHRRMSEVGPRTSFQENNSFFMLTGLEGALGESWDWSLSASYGQVLFNTRAVNSVNATALRQGLSGCQSLTPGGDGVLNTADDGENPLGVNALPGCLPLDIFGPNTLDANMQSFIRVNTFSDLTVEENRVSGYVRGDLFELPAGPIATVFGFEYRDTFAAQYNDNEQRSGNIYGFNAIQDQEGQIDVYELYMEAAVPLISEAPFAHYLGIEAGYRRSNYSTVGNVETYKIGGEWAPAEWLRFRAIFNQATRAPSVFEVFRAGDQGFRPLVDPCVDGNADGAPDGAGGATPTLAECIATGVPPGAYPGFTQQNAQIQVFGFGNPNLSTETGETLTYGIVFQPDWFPVGDLRATIDYYDIEVTDAIIAINAGLIFIDCFNNDSAAACARLVRNPSDGQFQGLGFGVNETVSNQGALLTSGYDIQLEWSVPVGPGQLTVSELYSILDEFTLETATGGAFALAGTTSAGPGGAFPDYKSVLSVSYNVGDWTLFGRWSYVPEMVSGSGFGVVGDAFAADPTVSPEASYVDVSARWNVTDAFTLTAVVDNVFDEYPPQTPDGALGNGQANTDPQIYRVLGRTFTLSGRYRF